MYIENMYMIDQALFDKENNEIMMNIKQEVNVEIIFV